MTDQERAHVRELRLRRRFPRHSPPHFELAGEHNFLISAACYEHAPIIGESPERMSECEEQLLRTLEGSCVEIHAWCILPNHYHVLVLTERIKGLLVELGRFHGRSSFSWNGKDNRRGRKVWYNCFERGMKSERHFWATVNYIHHNPVQHGYVELWQDWPWSSAAAFIEQVGRERATRMWREYPILDYGKKWDVN